MKTKITELLGIEYPIVQGAMAWIAEHHLAAAVSKAGGLGIIAGGAAPVDYIRDEIRKAREITDKPLGMNIMLLSPNADDLAQLAIDEKIEVKTLFFRLGEVVFQKNGIEIDRGEKKNVFVFFFRNTAFYFRDPFLITSHW